MWRSSALFAPTLVLALTTFAAAAAPAPFQPTGPVEPLASGIFSRPAAMSRPIFARPAAPTAAAPKATMKTVAPPLHRMPRPLVPSKAVAAPSSPDAKNPAPPPVHGSSQVPGHRRSLGW